MIEQISSIISMVGGAVSSIVLPVIGIFMFRDIRKRKLNAETKKLEIDNLTSYADEWKGLYEQRDKRVDELNAKIDQLYQEKEVDRQRIRELQEKNTALSLENQSLKIKECQVRGCKQRQPPSDY